MKGVAFIPIMRRREIVALAVVDAEDAERVAEHRWNLSGGYALNARKGPMHRFILGLEPFDRIVHHINEDKVDNRKANLQIFDSAAEANRAPHPKRDNPVRQATYRAARMARERSAA